MYDIQNKTEALAEYLEIKPEEIQYNETLGEYYTSEGTFTVMTEEEADKAHLDYIENFIEDLGIQGFTDGFQNEIAWNYIDQGEFKEICHEDYESYAEDIKNETFNTTYANRLIDECVEAKIIDMYDLDETGEYYGDLCLSEELTDYLVDRTDREYGGNFVEWYSDNFGYESLTQLISSRSYLIDTKAVSQACIDADGYGHSLASWDGKTIEQGVFYIFKQGDCDERSVDFINSIDNKVKTLPKERE